MQKKIEKVIIKQILYDLLGELIKFDDFNFLVFLRVLKVLKYEQEFLN